MSLNQHLIRNGDSTQAYVSGTKRKRGNHDSVEEEIAWTATRCQRILRTITSRISTLRKLLESDIGTESASNGSCGVPNKKPQLKKAEHWSSVDPAWLPNGKPKTLGRTYASKAKEGKRKVLKARDLNLAYPTPFVKRIGSAGNSNDYEQTKTPGTQPVKKSRRSRQLPVKPQSAQQETEQGLTAAVSAILSCTKAGEKARHGSRSLLSTCLRKVPGYIELSAEEDAGEGVTQDDVSTEVFAYLEDFGAREGWVGLRGVVRSQCIHLIAKAIDDNLVSENTISTLIDICSSQKALSDGQTLLHAWLKRAEIPSATSLERLDSFASQHRCYGFKFRTLNEVGRSQSSSMVRFGSTPMFWKDMLSSLTGDSSHEASCCLVSCVKTFARLESHEDLKAGIKSNMRDLALKVTVMATASVLTDEPLAGTNALRDGLLKVAAHISLRCARALQKQHTRQLTEFETLFMLGSQLVLGLSGDNQNSRWVFDVDVLTNILQALDSRTNGKKRNSDIRMRQEDFASEVTEGILTLEKFVGVNVTSKLLDRSLEAIEDGFSAASLLKQVALEITSVLRQADDSSANSDLEDYLKRLDQSTNKQVLTTETPHQDSKGGKFRWEEGICEWVTATPFLAKGAVAEDTDSAPEMNEDHEDAISSNECSPDVLALSPPPKRPRLQVRSPLWNKKVTKGVVVIPMYKPARRSSRRSVQEMADDSDDELCL